MRYGINKKKTFKKNKTKQNKTKQNTGLSNRLSSIVAVKKI